MLVFLVKNILNKNSLFCASVIETAKPTFLTEKIRVNMEGHRELKGTVRLQMNE